MSTITIDVLNDKIFDLLKELETLNLIRVKRNDQPHPQLKERPSLYKGVLSPEVADRLQKLINESRSE